MGELKVRGIVIASKDFKDFDKIVTIYSLEKGLIYAKLVGVKKPTAKLKVAKEIFCFAEFDLFSKNTDFLTVTSANVIENFYTISNDINKFYSGCLILEILKVVGRENENNEILFLETLKALKTLAYSNIQPKLVLVKYLLKIFEAMGYKLSLNKCPHCGLNFGTKRYFSLSEGTITCSACKTMDSKEISQLTHNSMRLTSNCDYEKLSSLKILDNAISDAFNLLVENFERKFDYKFVSTL